MSVYRHSLQYAISVRHQTCARAVNWLVLPSPGYAHSDHPELETGYVDYQIWLFDDRRRKQAERLVKDYKVINGHARSQFLQSEVDYSQLPSNFSTSLTVDIDCIIMEKKYKHLSDL